MQAVGFGRGRGFTPGRGTGAGKNFLQGKYEPWRNAPNKFFPPYNPLQYEERNKKMTPDWHWRTKFLEKQLLGKRQELIQRNQRQNTNRANSLANTPQALVSANAQLAMNNNTVEIDALDANIQAWEWAYSMLELQDWEDSKELFAAEGFISEFICWLLGKSAWNNPVITPWGYQRLVGPTIREFVKDFAMKKTEYKLELQKLKADPCPPTTIADAWIYWKYLVAPQDPKNPEPNSDGNFDYDKGFLPDMEYWIKSRQSGSNSNYVSVTSRANWTTDGRYQNLQYPELFPNAGEQPTIPLGDPGLSCPPPSHAFSFLDQRSLISQPGQPTVQIVPPPPGVVPDAPGSLIDPGTTTVNSASQDNDATIQHVAPIITPNAIHTPNPAFTQQILPPTIDSVVPDTSPTWQRRDTVPDIESEAEDSSDEEGVAGGGEETPPEGASPEPPRFNQPPVKPAASVITKTPTVSSQDIEGLSDEQRRVQFQKTYVPPVSPFAPKTTSNTELARQTATTEQTPRILSPEKEGGGEKFSRIRAISGKEAVAAKEQQPRTYLPGQLPLNWGGPDQTDPKVDAPSSQRPINNEPMPPSFVRHASAASFDNLTPFLEVVTQIAERLDFEKGYDTDIRKYINESGFEKIMDRLENEMYGIIQAEPMEGSRKATHLKPEDPRFELINSMKEIFLSLGRPSNSVRDNGERWFGATAAFKTAIKIAKKELKKR